MPKDVYTTKRKTSYREFEEFYKTRYNEEYYPHKSITKLLHLMGSRKIVNSRNVASLHFILDIFPPVIFHIKCNFPHQFS